MPARVCGFESLLRHQSPFSNVNLTDCRSHADIRALNLKATTGVEDDTSVCPSAGPLPVPASSPFQTCHETVSRTAGPAIEVMNKLSSIPRLTALLYFWHAPERMSVTDKERGSFGLTPLDIFFHLDQHSHEIVSREKSMLSHFGSERYARHRERRRTQVD